MRQSEVMRLKDWMKDRGLTLEQAAPRVGVTVSSLSKIVRGEIWVSGDTAERIRSLTDNAVSLDDLHDAWQEYHSGTRRTDNTGAVA